MALRPPTSTVYQQCQMAKSHKLSFPASTRNSTSPLALIHCDVWTSHILSLSGCRFYVLFIDDFSRFSWLYPSSNKSDVFACFIKLKCLFENLFSTKIKQFQSDGGGEFVSKIFQSFFSDHGIFHRVICPYTSQQNGIAERKHWHIVETGLSLLAHSHLPSTYWVEAFSTAIYLINRLPTPTLKFSTPYTLLFNKAPNYSQLRVFGCACYLLLCPYNRHKLEFCSKKCIFLGYSSNQKGYQCLDPSSHRVYISRHVVFDEKVFLAHDGSPLTASVGGSSQKVCFFLRYGFTPSFTFSLLTSFFTCLCPASRLSHYPIYYCLFVS